MVKYLGVPNMIYVDNRVGSKELTKFIAVDTFLTRLESGDFSFIGNGPDGPVTIGVERKALTDLLNSISTGRLSGYQLINMQQAYHYIYLLVEGRFQYGFKSGLLEWKKGSPIVIGGRQFTYREMIKYLNTLAVMCGMYIWFTRSKRETGMWLTYIFNWWQKDWKKHRAHTQFYSAPKPVTLVKPTLLRRIVNELEGVGWERSGDIVKEFNSLEKLMAASPKDLQKVKGIGKVMAQKIYNELREEVK